MMFRLAASIRIASYNASRQCRHFTSGNPLAKSYTHAVIGHSHLGRAIAASLAAREDTSTILLERCDKSAVTWPVRAFIDEESPEKSFLREEFIITSENSQTSQSFISHHPTQRVPTDDHLIADMLLFDLKSTDVELVSECSVSAISPHAWSGDYVITTFDYATYQSNSIEAEMVINASGPMTTEIANMLLPEPEHILSHYLKQTYFYYTGNKNGSVNMIIPPISKESDSLGVWYGDDGGVVIGPVPEWAKDHYDAEVNPSTLSKLNEHIKTHIPDSVNWVHKSSRTHIELRDEQSGKWPPVSITRLEDFNNCVMVRDGGEFDSTFDYDEFVRQAQLVNEMPYERNNPDKKGRGWFGWP